MGDDLLLFRVGARRCALPLSAVEETLRPLPVETIPDAPSFVLGAALIRGTPTPVVDLGALLSGETLGLDGARRAVTVKTGSGRRVALLVSDVIGIRNRQESPEVSMPSLLGEAALGTIEALGHLDGRLLTILQTAHLVPESVWRELG